jgi:hypothetical protein
MGESTAQNAKLTEFVYIWYKLMLLALSLGKGFNPATAGKNP